MGDGDWRVGAGSGPSEPMPPAQMEDLLRSLLDDFSHWFRRGEELLARCPETVLDRAARDDLDRRLREARSGVAATRALLSAAPEPVAVTMEVMVPWHRLVLEVWSLSSKLGGGSKPGDRG